MLLAGSQGLWSCSSRCSLPSSIGTSIYAAAGMDRPDHPPSDAPPGYGATELYGSTDTTASFYMKNILNVGDNLPNSPVTSPANVDYPHPASSMSHGYGLTYSGYGNQHHTGTSSGGLYQQNSGLSGNPSYYPDGCSSSQRMYACVTPYAGMPPYPGGTSYPGTIKSSCAYNNNSYSGFAGNTTAPYHTSIYNIDSSAPVPASCDRPKPSEPHPAYRDTTGSCSPTRQRVPMTGSLCSVPSKESITHTGE